MSVSSNPNPYYRNTDSNSNFSRCCCGIFAILLLLAGMVLFIETMNYLGTSLSYVSYRDFLHGFPGY